MNKYILTLNGVPKIEKMEEHNEVHPSNLLSGVITALSELKDIGWNYKPRLEFEKGQFGSVYIRLVVDGDKTYVKMDIYEKLLSYPFIDRVAIRFEDGKVRYLAAISEEWYDSSEQTIIEEKEE